jgi:hypothetical protein
VDIVFPKLSLCSAVFSGLVFVCLIGCGSGGGSVAPPPSPSFTLSLSAATISLTQGGAVQTVQISVVAQNGFASAVSITPSGFPSDISITPAYVSASPGTPGTFNISAAANTAPGKISGTFQGVSALLSANASLSLTIKSLLTQRANISTPSPHQDSLFSSCQPLRIKL